MNQLHKAGALILITLLLAACGPAAPTNVPATAQPDSAEDHFRQGNEHARAGQFAQAITAYQAALEVDPAHVSALTNLGVAYYNNGQLDEAVAQYQKALELAPEDADIYSNLAAAYVQQGKLDEALESYLTAIEFAPELAQAHFGLGVVYMQMEQNDKAIEAFESFQRYDKGEDAIATEQAQQYLEQLKGQ